MQLNVRWAKLIVDLRGKRAETMSLSISESAVEEKMVAYVGQWELFDNNNMLFEHVSTLLRVSKG